MLTTAINNNNNNNGEDLLQLTPHRSSSSSISRVNDTEEEGATTESNLHLDNRDSENLTQSLITNVSCSEVTGDEGVGGERGGAVSSSSSMDVHLIHHHHHLLQHHHQTWSLHQIP